ncbi:5-methyltetrahydropteroyltriglutamate--homocysteine S-methyltransferase [Spirosoma utsteinense]|uniref:5-methyltetrahydropteroyltriglutamate--homocysteine methyltransferase n=1 Tax=Spirosoma utsteinense TaxID=2585773 RepID=A0ABR6WGG2_9BACT|nr:5-methyltetrahydropteroyltriglutamate--homocysteine S-methyltransferase [Spirosoma utsteinense]MBC3789164.1 5-methyltetrahydropteroyltriglutamate--homocysteine methyltransferase [Spirosoma utsteinense]MBC3795087.1 5-methyltetrahydropteroyltriglutamate--homocysteine methyltransferase [Spirosoma utsteinense]
MQTHNLGYPRIGSHRELKRASEQFWAGNITRQQLQETGLAIRQANWLTQQQAGIALIPCNDFSFYDQVLDMSLTVGAIPDRFAPLLETSPSATYPSDLYFAMARGYQQEGLDLKAMEMTKWFDTNYHYIVPEFRADQTFTLSSDKLFTEFDEARQVLGKTPKPMLLGPVSYLLLGKEKDSGFNRLDLLERLLPIYEQILTRLQAQGTDWIQFDEPGLSLNLTQPQQDAFATAYQWLRQRFPTLKFLLASYFECYGDNLNAVIQLPVDCLHLDLVRCPSQLADILQTDFTERPMQLSLGVVDGRNIWINDMNRSQILVQRAIDAVGADRVMIAPSCSLLHVPCDLTLETNGQSLPAEVKQWLAFARQKLAEVATLATLISDPESPEAQAALASNQAALAARSKSARLNRPTVQARVRALTDTDAQRSSPFAQRQTVQREQLNLPLFPTTTIGSFPQTEAIRTNRSKLKKGEQSQADYDQFIETEITEAIRWQEDIGLDVLVHGEFERNDMVEYFGERLDGFAFSANGWVQSYGSRCVKPPILFGDVARSQPMTVRWTQFAQSLTDRPVKGMLTGPVTILQWSFVRDDQPRRDTCLQLALAVRDEVVDLAAAGIRIIQIDEPAIREGLPLRRENWATYLDWAGRAFRVAASGVADTTQIHTHMCYSEFNDIMGAIAALDADVITIETSRSQMELLDAFVDFNYPNEIGPGVYDIHSPSVPTVAEMTGLLHKAMAVLPAHNLWVNPDCGLKTRRWPETAQALTNMVRAAQQIRQQIAEPA